MKINRNSFIRSLGIVGLLSTLALGGCITDKPLSPSEDGQQGPAIAFGVADASLEAASDTRASIVSSLREIGVFGYTHTGSFDGGTPDWFFNQNVADLPGNGTWTYEGVTKYWPRKGRNLSLFAYAPYINVEDTFVLHPQDRTDTGRPTISYIVPAGITEQIDLMWGNALDRNLSTNPSGRVDLSMNHALTKVDFRVRLAEDEKGRPFLVRFDELTVRNVIGAGVLNLSKVSGPALWSLPTPITPANLTSYVMTPGGHGGLVDLWFYSRIEDPAAGDTDPWSNTDNNLFHDGKFLMLIPQTLDDKGIDLPAEVVLKYTVKNVYSGTVEHREDIIPLSGDTLPSWQPGQGITYRITVTLLHGVQIEYGIEGFLDGTPWVDDNSDNPSTGEVS